MIIYFLGMMISWTLMIILVNLIRYKIHPFELQDMLLILGPMVTTGVLYGLNYMVTF